MKQKEEQKTKTQLIKEKAKNSASKVGSEFKKAISTALIAAFGFIIALEWRGVIQEFITEINNLSPIQGKLISAIIVTFISVMGIILTTSLLHQE